jgi:hypothetical protein
MYMQPVVMQQPVMMMQPQPMMMMQQPQPAAGPTIIINKNEDEFDCPKCNKGNLLETKKFTFMTCIFCMILPCSLCLCPDCVYSKKKICNNNNCLYEESV